MNDSSDSELSYEEEETSDHETPRTLNFLPVQPFADLGLIIDSKPIQIVDGSEFDENTIKLELTVARGVAVTLWLWCPDALRVFLDGEKYDPVEWNRRATGTVCITARHSRQLTMGYYVRRGKY